MKTRPAIDHSVKGSRPTAGEVKQALAIFAAPKLPKTPPVKR